MTHNGDRGDILAVCTCRRVLAVWLLKENALKITSRGLTAVVPAWNGVEITCPECKALWTFYATREGMDFRSS